MSYANGRRVTALPGQAYGQSRHGRRAPQKNSYNNPQKNSYNNPLLVIKNNTRTKRATNPTNRKVQAPSVRTGGTKRTKATAVSRRTPSAGRQTTTYGRNNGNAARQKTTTSKTKTTANKTNKTKTAAAPRSSQHRAVGKSSSLQVGQYLVGKTIGQGTFGKVKLGVHAGTGEKVAIKILEKKKIVEVADVERVSREILILKRVGAVHDNVIRLFEVIDTPKAIYLIMEYCSGGELFDFIVKQGKIKERQACNFFHQILNGCEYLHQNHIVHRDLKPENLLMNRRPEGWNVKVVDFGLSNTDDGGKLLKTACGSPCYAAPEMIAGKKYVGPKADMWSLGVVLFALVCGFLPFEHDNTSELYKKILKGDYKCPKFISPQVKDLLKKILNTNPKQRYTIAQCRKHPWMKMVTVKNITHSKPLPRPMVMHQNKSYAKNAINGSGSQNPESPTNAGNILANLDQQVLKQCTDLGFKPAQVVEGLVNKLENSATKAYTMLCSRKIKLAEAQRKRSELAATAKTTAKTTAKKVQATTLQTIPPFSPKPTAGSANTATLPVGAKPQQPPVPLSVLETASGTTNTTTAAATTTAATTATTATTAATTAAAATTRGRRVVPAANQDRNVLPQQPHRPSGGPSLVKKTVVERQALNAVSLVPMSSEGEGGVKATTSATTTSATTTSATTAGGEQAWKTPRVDENGQVVLVVPTRPPEGRHQQPVSARVGSNSGVSTGASSGSQTSRLVPTQPLAAADEVGTTNTAIPSSTPMDIVTGAFNVSHTSSKEPAVLLTEMKRVLQSISIPFSMSKDYQLTCHKQNTRFKVEVSIVGSLVYFDGLHKF
jgi:serine/threonine protein kinase